MSVTYHLVRDHSAFIDICKYCKFDPQVVCGVYFDLMVLVKNVTICLMVATHGYLVIGPVLSLNQGTGMGSAVV